MKKICVLLTIVIFLWQWNDAGANSGQTTGMQFLLMGPSAQNMGISDGHTASLTGSSAIFINPALLSMEARSSATASYMLWPSTDTQNSFAGAVLNRGNSAWGAALLSSIIDDIPFRSGPTRDPDGLFAIRYFSVAGSYSRSFGPFSLGLTGMFLHEQFFQHDASGFALTAGMALNLLEDRIRLGASLRNLGSMDELAETATNLPTLFSAGTEVHLLQFSTSAIEDEIPLLLTLVTDFNIPLNEIDGDEDTVSPQDDGYFNVGLELNISEIIDLRAGYRTGDTQRRFGYGAGLMVSDFYFNYAFMPFKTGFGAAHAISMQYYF